jgi:hypothetical protein
MSDSMYLNLLNVNRDIEINGWKEVTSPNSFVPNTTELHPEGLFSTEIFGEIGTNDRKIKWGYISLNDVFMNPHAYYVLNRLKKAIAEDMKTGTNRYYVDANGEITKLATGKTVPADAKYKVVGCGFDWLKEAWPHISWRITKDMSTAAKLRRKWLKSFPVDAIFWDKFPICPAFYRDIDFKSSKRNIINKMYSKILHLAGIIKNMDNLMFSEDPDTPLKTISHAKLQDAINEVSEFFFTKIGGANGFINNHVVGKATDYGARLVISTPSFNYERWNDAEVDFFHSSVPMAVAINIYAPFMIFNIKRWITNHVSGGRFLTVLNRETGELEELELSPSFMDEFSTDGIRKMLDLYKKSKEYRVKPITLKGIDGVRIPIQAFMKYDTDTTSISFATNLSQITEGLDKTMIRDLSYCELFYIISHDCLKDKCIDTTRYPADDYYHTFPSLMNIIPANKYTKVIFNGMLYERYPIIKTNDPVEIEHLFSDTLKMFSIYPASLGADFDGDQVSVQSLFADESNIEAKKQMNNISHILGIDGEIMRGFPHVIEHGIYNLTYRNRKPDE